MSKLYVSQIKKTNVYVIGLPLHEQPFLLKLGDHHGIATNANESVYVFILKILTVFHERLTNLLLKVRSIISTKILNAASLVIVSYLLISLM